MINHIQVIEYLTRYQITLIEPFPAHSNILATNLAMGAFFQTEEYTPKARRRKKNWVENNAAVLFLSVPAKTWNESASDTKKKPGRWVENKSSTTAAPIFHPVLHLFYI